MFLHIYIYIYVYHVTSFHIINSTPEPSNDFYGRSVPEAQEWDRILDGICQDGGNEEQGPHEEIPGDRDHRDHHVVCCFIFL